MSFTTLLFDAYGTLFQLTAPPQLDERTQGRAAELMSVWRRKQLEYTWLRSLMQRHTNFEQVSEEALRYAMQATGLTDASLIEYLMPIYQRATAFEEVPEVLRQLKARSATTAILSNGTPDMLEAGLQHAQLKDLIDHVYSVETIGIFKPFPAVYQMALNALDVSVEDLLFVSANAWDVAGAASAGLNVAWINRKGQIAEFLPAKASFEVNSLRELLEKIQKVS